MGLVDFEVVWEDMLAILTTVPFTLGTAMLILLLGILVGLGIALVRIRKVPVAYPITMFLIHYTRGIPLLIHLYLVYYALPLLLAALSSVLGFGAAIQVSPLAVLVAAYALYASIAQSETIRGAFVSVDTKQWDAAYSIGLTGGQALCRIVLPQCLSVAVPVFFNSYLTIIKGLSLAFTIGVTDILARAKICSAQNFHYLEAYIAAGLVYWGLCVLLGILFGRIEKAFTKW